MTHEMLIAICERAAAYPYSKWNDRDCAEATMQLGRCWALLKAGCPFYLSRASPCISDARTWWITVNFTDFSGFEYGERNNAQETFYLPTMERLDAEEGGCWY